MAKAAQTVSQLGLHLGVAVGVGYAMTGSLAIGGAVALVEPVCNVVAGRLHDKAWERLRGRRK
ncbi:MAG: DUF2061 domain-containing protein [Magnetospirillum sp.]|nr:DUF2061 domain-containing protein [Magnetospirillum sp.]